MLTLDQIKLSDEVRETLSKRGIDSMTKLLNIDSVVRSPLRAMTTCELSL